MRLLETSFAEVPREVLFGIEGRVRAASERQLHGHGVRHAHEHDHGAEFAAWSWRSDVPLDRAAFRDALRRLPPALLRAKGVIAFADRPSERAVFQLVGRRHSIEAMEGPAPTESTLVAIARAGSLDGAALTGLFDACRAGDQRR
jgi:G3E family GTPase